MNLSRYFTNAAIVLLALASASQTTFGQSTRELSTDQKLEFVIADMLQETKSFLATESTTELAISPIASPPSSSAGPKVTQILIDQAETVGLTVKKFKSRFVLGGKFRGAEKEGKPIVKFDFWINDSDQDSNPEVKKFGEIILDRPSDVNTLLGRTDSSGTGGQGEDSHSSGSETSTSSTQSLGSTNNPLGEAPVIEGDTVYAKGNRDYGVQILVKRSGGYEVLTPRLEEGVAVVGLSETDVYGVRTVNNSPSMSAVDLSIDGLSYFRFSKGNNFTHYILRPRAKALIKGWYISTTTAREFLVKPLSNAGNSEVAQTVLSQSNQSRLGTITVQFHQAYDGRTRSLFTDAGATTSVKYKMVNARWDENPLCTISIRYDRR